MNTKALLLTAGLLLIARDEPPPTERPARPPATRISPVRPAAVPLLRLVPGVLDEARLKGGEERSYLLDLAAGQYAELVVDQRGIDVEVRLRTANQRLVAAVDGFNGMIGPEPLPVVAEIGGRFRLEIQSLTSGAPAGRYVLRLAALRPATAHDRARVEAERMLSEGIRSYQEDTPASRQSALERSQEALARFRTLGLPEREAAALFCLGKVSDRLGDRETAANFYQQALALFRVLGNEADAGITLSNLGALERFGGRPERALALYREALPLHRRTRNRPEEAQTLTSIGRAAMDLGEIGQAISAFEQAISLNRSLGDRVAEGKALSNLGLLETKLDQLPRALDHLGQAVTLLEALRDRRGLGEVLARMGVARALAGHSRQEVLATFRRALRLQGEAGDRSREAVTLHNLGWYYQEEGEVHQAERIFRETLAIFDARGERASQAGALVNLGGIELKRRRLAQAEESFTRALALLAGIGDPDNEATALFGLARVRQAAGRPAEALAAVESAFACIEALRRKPEDLDLRLSFFASKQDIYGLRIDLLMELHRPERALVASEDARARTLLDLLDNARVGAGPRAAEIAETRVARFQDLQRQIVEPGSLILEYYLGRERSFLWALTPGTIESFELPAREVLEAEARRVALLLGASSKALARRQTELALADLSLRLLAPVAHRLRGAERLVIVPDGALWYIPFAALPEPGAGDRPLMVSHEIVTIPSLSVLSRGRLDPAGRRHAPGTIAVVADPVFAAADPRVTPRPAVSRETSGRFKRLPFSRAEAEAILSVAPRQGRWVALDFAASRDAITSGRLARYRIVHFATHAVVDTENPDLSSVVLSLVDSQGRPRNGFLRLADLYSLHLPADLVVLSACRTALGREIRGEGLVGLTRGFFSAGARQVLVSLWPVEDRATAELMRRFYAEVFGRKRPPAAALREAQIAMWRERSWRSAYYWAGFTIQGDWRVPLDKPSPPDVDL